VRVYMLAAPLPHVVAEMEQINCRKNKNFTDVLSRSAHDSLRRKKG
jgi:hypothetical protein